jgi:hypothetical protein
MALSQEEKDRISEEENLRFETRMKAHERIGKGASCGTCGHKPACNGCRILGVVLGAVLLFFIFRSFACTHEDRRHFYGYGDRAMMGSQVQNAPFSGSPAPAHNP